VQFGSSERALKILFSIFNGINNMSEIHLDKIQNLAGFATKNVKKGKTAKLLVRASLISDEQEFYTYTDQISNLFLNKSSLSPIAKLKKRKRKINQAFKDCRMYYPISSGLNSPRLRIW